MCEAINVEKYSEKSLSGPWIEQNLGVSDQAQQKLIAKLLTQNSETIPSIQGYMSEGIYKDQQSADDRWLSFIFSRLIPALRDHIVGSIYIKPDWTEEEKEDFWRRSIHMGIGDDFLRRKSPELMELFDTLCQKHNDFYQELKRFQKDDIVKKRDTKMYQIKEFAFCLKVGALAGTFMSVAGVATGVTLQNREIAMAGGTAGGAVITLSLLAFSLESGGSMRDRIEQLSMGIASLAAAAAVCFGTYKFVPEKPVTPVKAAQKAPDLKSPGYRPG